MTNIEAYVWQAVILAVVAWLVRSLRVQLNGVGRKYTLVKEKQDELAEAFADMKRYNRLLAALIDQAKNEADRQRFTDLLRDDSEAT
jgi:hypothetical protein